MLSQSPSGEPRTQSRMCESAAKPADAALESPRAAMISAPRCWTPGMNSSRTQASSTSSGAGRPPTAACAMSGNWVAEWLPQIVIRDTSPTAAPVRAARRATARLWSSRVIAVNCEGSRSGAFFIAMRAFVLAGLPTTSTLTSRAACSLRARPCGPKIRPFSASRSLRSMPLPRGRAPTRRAKRASRNASFGSSVTTKPCTRGYAQSSISITTPPRAGSAGGISRSWRMTGWSGPSISPEAIRKRSEYAI